MEKQLHPRKLSSVGTSKRKRKRKHPEAAFFHGSGKDKIKGSRSGSSKKNQQKQKQNLPPLPLFSKIDDRDIQFFWEVFVRVSLSLRNTYCKKATNFKEAEAATI